MYRGGCPPARWVGKATAGGEFPRSPLPHSSSPHIPTTVPSQDPPHRDTTTTANRIRLPAEPVTGTWDRGSPLHWGLDELGTLGSRTGPGPRETPGLSRETPGLSFYWAGPK
jgi:hypothetical protein